MYINYCITQGTLGPGHPRKNPINKCIAKASLYKNQRIFMAKEYVDVVVIIVTSRHVTGVPNTGDIYTWGRGAKTGFDK